MSRPGIYFGGGTDSTCYIFEKLDGIIMPLTETGRIYGEQL